MGGLGRGFVCQRSPASWLVSIVNYKLIGTRDRDQVRKFARTSRGRSYMEQTTENRTQEIVADTVRTARIFMENLRDSNAEHDDNDNSASA